MNTTNDVQAITAIAAASDLSGYFFVGYEGHWSEKIAYDASADDMAAALAGIPAVGDVTVRYKQTEHALRFLLALVVVLNVNVVNVEDLDISFFTIGATNYAGRTLAPWGSHMLVLLL